jgi:hypothetical protein
VVLAAWSLNLASIVTAPTLCAVANPLLLMFTVAGSEELHVTNFVMSRKVPSLK